jgi:hypothetical protein
MTPLQAARRVGLRELEARLLALGASAPPDRASAAAPAAKRSWWRAVVG